MLLDGRYRCFRLIKSGHGIETYLAEDLQGGGDQVIVKLLRTEEVAPEVRVRLEHEAAVLARLGTPTFKPLVAYGQDDGRLFLVQPFLPGKNLSELLALSGGPLSVMNTLVIAADLLSELSRAHEEGILHRDVKPANVLVQGDDPVEGATLVDFGLSLSSSLHADFKNQAVGTARYLSPEEAGLVDAVIDGRSDIYSLGAVLYECLTGHPLFEGTTVGEVLRQHLSLQVPRLRAAGLPVPRALEGVLLRMLGKEPGQRYQSAQGALADVEEIIAGLKRGVSEPPVVIGLHDRRSVLTEPAFVGRTSELATLNEHLKLASAGRGALFYLAAESGGGKTRLLEEFAGQASSSGAWILNGQGVDQAAQHPYQLLGGVAKDINSAIQSDEQLLARLLRRLGDRAEAVAVTLPELGAFVSHAGIEKLPEAYGEVRSLTALSSLLGSLGTPETPAVVLLDDCQWTDGLTAKLLDRWLSQTSEEPTYVLVVAAFRSEEVGPHHPIRRISPTARLDLQPLTTSELHDMVQSMAGRLPDEVMDTVATLSEGSPFMAAAVLMGLVETGAVFESAGGWKVDDAALAAAQTSRRAAIFLVRRLELLPEEALRLLSIGAVLGKEFDLDLAISLTGQSHDDALKALDEARSRKIIWLDESGGRCHFLHDKIREALLGKLDGEERTELHRRAALQIEELDSSRVFELAYHFDAAGEAERALPFAVAAAEHARSQHTLEIAEVHYRMADRSAANAGLATRRRVAEGLGDVLTLRGSYEEAVEQFKRSLGMTEDRQSRAALQGKLGDVAFRYGDMVGARDALEGALKQLNFRMPRTFLGLMLALFWEVAIQALHSALPKLFIGRRSLDNTERQLLAVRLYSRLAYVYWFHSGKLRCGWAHLREMNLAERYPPTLELAQAYSEHAPVMTMVPWFSRGLDYAKRSHKIRTELGDVWGQGQSLNFEGVTLYAASRFEEAIERCLEAKRLLERTGDRWEVNTAGWNIAFAQYRLGRRAEAIQTAKGVHAAATEIGDQAAAGIALSGWSRASEGDVPSELIKAQLDRSGDEDASTTVEVHLAEGVRLLRTGEIDRAVSVLQAARGLIRKAGLRQEYVAPVFPWLATALRIQMEQFAANSAVPRRTLLRNVLVTRRAVRLSRSYRNNLPHALREQGLIAALDRRPRTSRRKLIASLKAAKAQGARFEEAKTLEAIARIGEKLGWAEASDSKRAAEALMLQIQDPGPADQPDRDTLSLADRFAALMEAGRSIASASDREGVYQSVQKAAKALLRGEHCFVLDLHGHGSEAAENALHGHESLSFTIVERALELDAPVVSNFADSVDATESLVLSGVRSVMCVPISSEEGALALLYVTHGLVSGLFGEEEIQLASYISTLAGAALDHVAGSEARFRSLAQNSSDVITIVDPGGQITYQSSSLEPIFGFQPLEMIGSRLDKWVHPADVQQVHQSINFSDSAGGGNALLECRLRASDGSWRYTETAISNLIDDPSVRGVVLNTRDVTERKALEARAHIALEQAEEASRLKSQFLANMSHEIRTPMNGVLGMAHLLERTKLTANQRRHLQALQESGTNLLEIINDILDFSKVEAGKVELESIPFDLVGVVQGTVEVVASSAESKGLLLELEINPDVPSWVIGDPIRVRQVLTNLLGNAVKFTDSGRIDLNLTRVGSNLLRFEVRDTGIGIDPAAHRNLLDPFTQADTSTTRRFGGTGLGLAISSQLVELMGGKLTFESKPGIGSVFHFEVPLPAAGAPAIAQVSESAEEAPAASLPEEAGRALLVEDSYVNQLVAAGMLKSLGYRVDLAPNGADALEKVQHNFYDVILMDCLMPVMDGYEATALIRALEGPVNATPIIALTASAMAGDRDKCLTAGMDDYLSKPVDPSELREVLSAARRRRTNPWQNGHKARTSPGENPAGIRTHVDEATLAGLRKLGASGDGTLLKRVIEAFLSDAPSRINEMIGTVRSNNASGLVNAAHALKGSCRNIGAQHLAELTERLELMGRSGKLDTAQGTIALIQTEFEEVRTALAGETALAS